MRQDYLDPLIRALGWDLENHAGLIQKHREIEIESRTDVAGRAKRADYLFRTDGHDRFICEAKKPRVVLGPRDAFQAKRFLFLRICEDRDIDTGTRLQSIVET